MSYREALEAAGAKIHALEYFGSYQGDWYALVTYEGETGFVHGYFGSCTVCDAFQSEFGWTDDDRGCADHSYDYDDSCEDCLESTVTYRARLVDFGKSYLTDLKGFYAVCDELKERLDWDSESEVALEWICEAQRMWETFQ